MSAFRTAVAVPAGLAIAFFVTKFFGSRHPSACTRNRQLGRRRLTYLVLCGLCPLEYLCRAIDLLRPENKSTDAALIYTLEQILLQVTIFLTLLSSSSPSLVPYLTVWVLTLASEISLAVSPLAGNVHIGTITVTLWILTVVTLLLLVASSLSSLVIRSESCDSEERASLLGKSSTYSDDADRSCNSSTTESSLINYSDTGTDFSDDDEEEEEARKLSEGIEEAGGLLQYLASYKVFIPYILPRKNTRMQLYMAVVVLNTLLQRALNVISPYLLGKAVDKLAKSHEFPVKEIIASVVLNLVASDMCGLSGLNDALLERIGAWSRQALVVAGFDKIMSLSADFHDSKDSGEVIKAVEQAESLGELFKTMIEDVVPGILDVIIATWYVGFLLDAYAALVIVAVGIGFVFSTIFMSGPLRQSRKTLARSERQESEILYETIGNWATISYFNRKMYESGRLKRAAEAVATADVHNEDMIILMFASQELSERAGFIAVLLLAAYRICQGTSTIGAFMAVERYWGILAHPLYVLGSTYRHSASELIDAERLLQLFKTEVKVKDKPNAQPLRLSDGKIEFLNVDFAYEGSRKVIRELNMSILPGQTVALVGATGSGKSTITKLLMRFYDINSGQILVDGQDVSCVTLSSLRDSFGVVPQESVLFNATIAENVQYGRLDATEQEVRKACEAACIHERIMTLPKGYRTKVGERGVKLSGGERQRIAIARVLLRNPQIVILDEATSALDSQTESELQTALKKLRRGRTCVVVAHRLSTIVDADVIMVVEDGRITERGVHQELLRSSGKYCQLWERQVAQSKKTETEEIES